MPKAIRAILHDLAELDTRVITLTKFGFIVGGILLLLCGLAYYHGKFLTAAIVGLPGIALFGAGALFPRVLVGVYRAWMALGMLLGLVISPIILGAIYYLILSPIAFLAGIFVGDPLEHTPKEGSYWIPREKGWTKETMERLF